MSFSYVVTCFIFIEKEVLVSYGRASERWSSLGNCSTRGTWMGVVVYELRFSGGHDVVGEHWALLPLPRVSPRPRISREIRMEQQQQQPCSVYDLHVYLVRSPANTPLNIGFPCVMLSRSISATSIADSITS